MLSGLKKLGARLSDAFESVSTTPANVLRASILAGEESKALELYTGVPSSSSDAGGASTTVTDPSSGYAQMKGGGLVENLHPSTPFASKKYSDQTPMHLASLYALDKLVVEFLKHGGNPNSPNAKDETCIHAVCAQSDRAQIRFELLNLFLKWKGPPIDGVSETVSINHVDRDGNTAIHNAASSGLLDCVQRLITLGAIISIVNGHQRTCCEMADEGGYPQLARMLELSLVFQPAEAMDAFGLDQQGGGGRGPNAPLVPIFFVDCESHTAYSLAERVESLLEEAVKATGEPRARAETLLFAADWSLGRLARDWAGQETRAALLAKCNLQPPPPTPPPPPPPPLPTDQAQRQRAEAEGAAEGAGIAATPTPTPLLPPLPGPDAEADAEAGAIMSTTATTITSTTTSSTAEADAGAEAVPAPAPLPSSCPICGDNLDPELPLSSLERGFDPSPLWPGLQSAVSCGAGHAFCLSCWQQHSSLQVDDGAACLRCPAFKCGECLELDWAPLLLRELPSAPPPSSSSSGSTSGGGMRGKVRRLHRARIRRMVSSATPCRHPSCGLLVLADTDGSLRPIDVTAQGYTPSSGGGVLDLPPQSAVCSLGHAHCLSCNEEAHSPCSCSDWQLWKRKVAAEVQGAAAGGVGGGGKAQGLDDVASALWMSANTKQCPKCSAVIEKDEGCNHMACRKVCPSSPLLSSPFPSPSPSSSSSFPSPSSSSSSSCSLGRSAVPA